MKTLLKIRFVLYLILLFNFIAFLFAILSGKVNASECNIKTDQITKIFESDFFKTKFEYYCNNYNHSKKCMEKSYNALFKLYNSCFIYEDRETIILNAFIYNTKGQPVGLNWMKIDMHTSLKKLENSYENFQ